MTYGVISEAILLARPNGTKSSYTFSFASSFTNRYRYTA